MASVDPTGLLGARPHLGVHNSEGSHHERCGSHCGEEDELSASHKTVSVNERGEESEQGDTHVVGTPEDVQ